MEIPNALKIFFLAAESEPFIKVGGLADYAGSLPKALTQLSARALKNRDLDIRIAIPYHGKIVGKNWGINHLIDFKIFEKGKPTTVRIFTTKIDDLVFYFISRQHREKANSAVYPKNNFNSGRKFAFFSIASLELLKKLNWQADVIHANDWHTAFALIKLAQIKNKDPFFKNTKSLLTIHNLAYMGGGSEKVLADYGLLPIPDPLLPVWAQHQPLPMALAVADTIVAVSPSYAHEIRTHNFGYGLEKLIEHRKKSVFGILNGIDYEKWNPQTDACIEFQYSISNLRERKVNKLFLQEKFDLPKNKKIPLITIISRLDFQKGVDVVIDGFEKIEKSGIQLIILGSGSVDLEMKCRQLEKKYPKNIRAIMGFNPRLANQLYGGSDLILIPSRFEPCGLTQMIAMHYGCLPIARATGGLKDSIRNGFNGFLFRELTLSNFAITFKQAINMNKNNRKMWNLMQKNAMLSDFSWAKSARAYARLYSEMLDD
jgi:starch synthase